MKPCSKTWELSYKLVVKFQNLSFPILKLWIGWVPRLCKHLILVYSEVWTSELSSDFGGALHSTNYTAFPDIVWIYSYTYIKVFLSKKQYI